MIAGAPTEPVPLPRPLRDVVGDRSARCTWVNQAGGLTFELDGGEQFLKWSPTEAAIDLRAEAVRLRWARSYTPVPIVADEGAADGGRWLLTEALPGRSAVAPRWLADPAMAVTAIGHGLRRLHDALPVADCPWPVTNGLEPREDGPDVDVLVVCHGDACAPNTLLTDDGHWSGHVDLGALGVADRWADLAIATWSTEWNYGPGWEQPLLDAYGVDADVERTAWFRRLWGPGPTSFVR